MDSRFVRTFQRDNPLRSRLFEPISPPPNREKRNEKALYVSSQRIIPAETVETISPSPQSTPTPLFSVMPDRRDFLKRSALFSMTIPSLVAAGDVSPSASTSQRPVVVSTWAHGIPANEAAWEVLDANGSALDAVEAGVRVTEADPETRTVGRGGYPDRDGTVTLDACVMDERGRCGAVAALEDILYPTSVARKVMEETPHVMLVGDGARDFAVAQGFEPTDLLTEQSKRDWREWKETQSEAARPEPNVEQETNSENHDTIGMLALDAHGNLSGACTTSGTKWKMPGRVGDSPLIGAGLYVDNDIGAACATGWGEAVIRTAGAHLAVERMRQGASPTAACRAVIDRIESIHDDTSDVQVGVLALNTRGEIGAYSLQSGFDTARYTPSAGNRLAQAEHSHPATD